MTDDSKRRDDNLTLIPYSVRRFQWQTSDTGDNVCTNDEDKGDAVKRMLVPVENDPFEIELLLADS